MITPSHIWCWELAKKIAEEKWTTAYKTIVWNKSLKLLKKERKRFGAEFVVFHDGKWKRLSGWTPNKQWVELFIVGWEDGVDIQNLQVRQVFMKSPSQLGVYSISDMWEYKIEKEFVDEGDGPWYYTAIYYYVVNKYGSFKISYSSTNECKRIKSYLNSLPV